MPRVRPQSNNIKISVSTQQTDNTVSAKTTDGTNPVKASNSMAEYWSNKSKEWAISENIVDGEDYSSKHYAEQSKESYDGIEVLVDGFSETVISATNAAVNVVNETKNDAIEDVQSAGDDYISQMTSLKNQTEQYKNSAATSASNASISETNASNSATSASSSATSAYNYAASSSNSATLANGSANTATTKAQEASSYASSASASASEASGYANSASTSATNAHTSEVNAQTYASNANTSATNASTSEDNANIWAEGTDSEVQALGGVHSAKRWAEESATGQIQSDWDEADSTEKSYIRNKPDLTVYATSQQLTTGLGTLQGEIDTINLKQNVVDVTGTYAELQLYDTSTLTVNDEVGVLQDETHDGAYSVYTWNGTTFTYRGSTAPSYTKSETNTFLDEKADTDLSNLTATGEAHFLKNTATGTHSLTIDGTSSTQQHTVNIGSGSKCTNYQAVAIGTNATTSAISATAIGYGAIASGGSSIALGGAACRASAKESYQIGVGTNSTARSLQIGFTKSDNTTIVVYQLLDGTTGLIPDDRISKQTSITSSSTDAQIPSAKSVIELLKTIYPVGSVYLSTTSTCPLSSLFGTWSKISAGKALWTAGTDSTYGITYNVDTYYGQSLPNIYGVLNNFKGSGSQGASGVFSYTRDGTYGQGSSTGNSRWGDTTFDASTYNSTYSSTNAVRTACYAINAWRRTA